MASYNWMFNTLKRAEGGPGVQDAVRAVHKIGGTAHRGDSAYVGNELIVVTAPTKKLMRKALGAVKRSNPSFIESIKDTMRYEVRSRS